MTEAYKAWVIDVLVDFADEKVVDLEAQRRADELHAAKEEMDALHNLQQPNLSNQPTSEQTVGPS